MDNVFAQYLIRGIALIAMAACLVIMGLQFRASKLPQSQGERIARSALVGLLIGAGLLSFLFFIGTFSDTNQWSLNAFGASLCLVAPFVLMSGVGAYIRFGQVQWLYQTYKHTLEKARRAGKPSDNLK